MHTTTRTGCVSTTLSSLKLLRFEVVKGVGYGTWSTSSDEFDFLGEQAEDAAEEPEWDDTVRADQLKSFDDDSMYPDSEQE